MRRARASADSGRRATTADADADAGDDARVSRAADGADAGDVHDVADAGHRVVCHLDALLAERGMTLAELARRADVTVVNLSVLKNDRARAIRFSTLTAVCDVLGCQPGDVLSVAPR